MYFVAFDDINDDDSDDGGSKKTVAEWLPENNNQE